MHIDRMLSVLVRRLPLLLAFALTTGCTAKMRMQHHLRKADEYFAAGDYEKAKIEYINVVRADPKFQPAYAKVGTMWMEQGAPLRAGPFLFQATQLAPNDADTRLKLARVYLGIGATGEAMKNVASVTQQAPANGEALLVYAESSRTVEEVAMLANTLAAFPDKNSLYYHLAAANLAVRRADWGGAEAAFRQALEVDPKSPLPHMGLGTLYVIQKDYAKAEGELKAAADASGPHGAERIRYAEFLASTGKVDQAEAVLKNITAKAPDMVPAWRMLAQIALSRNKLDECLALLENANKIDQDNPDCRMLEAEARIKKGDGIKAVQGLERLDKAYPNTPTIKMQLARAHIINNDLPTAGAILGQALAVSPNYVDAALLLAEVNLRLGDVAAVIRSMTDLLQKQPQLERAAMLLAEAYRVSGQLDAAETLYRAMVDAAPQDAQAYLALASVLRQQKKLDEMVAVLQKAAEIAPNPVVIDQLVNAQLDRGDAGAALQTVERQLAKTPDVPSLHVTLGKVYATKQQFGQAETEFSRAAELDPNFTPAYDSLIAIYIATNRLPEAAARLEALIAKAPNNPAGLMILAMVHERQGEWGKARDDYEKLLTMKPEFAPALNNLAYIYSEKLPDLERAADLARKARAQQPGDPSVADTLGWIVYKQGDYQQAAALLQEAGTKLVENPEVQFHLGMSSYMMGRTGAAKTALQKAASAPQDFPGKAEAQERLAQLEHGGAAPPPTTGSPPKPGGSQPGGDIVALMRSAESYEKEGQVRKAADALEQALKSNSKLVPPLLKLAELYAGPLKDKPKALDYAKRAREVAPSDEKATRVLGRVAYEAGNWSWAAGLLQESARRMPDDAKVQYDYGWAAYSIGKVTEARQAMEKVTQLAPGTPEADDAKLFLSMTPAPDASAPTGSDAEAVLAGKQGYVPAMMIKARAAAAAGDSKTAEDVYSAVLQRFSDFTPAQRALAEVYSADPKNAAKAYEVAVKARKSLADDPDFSRVFGKIAYQKNEYAQAIQALQQSSRKKPLEAEGLFYLGMSQMNAHQDAQGRQSLAQALAAGLADPYASEAHAALEKRW